MSKEDFVPLATLVEHSLGGDWGHDPSDQTDGYVSVKVVRGTDFTRWQSHRASGAADRRIKVASLEKRRLREGDLVVEASGGGPTQPVGRVMMIDKAALEGTNVPLVCSNFFRQLRLVPSVDPRYVERYLRLEYLRGKLDKFQTQTTNLRNLRFNDFLNGIAIPIRDIDEQRRIANQLDHIAAHLDDTRARLDTIPAILKRFRMSVLAAACSGRLTEDWRRRRGSSTAETVIADSEFDLPELPGNWHYVKLSEAITSQKYGTSKRCAYEQEGKPVLRIPNIGDDGRISAGDLKFGDLPEREYEQLALRDGDLLLIRSNGSVSLVGRCALVTPQFRGYAYAGYLIRLRPNPEVVLPEFLIRAMAAPAIRLQIELPARSTSGVNNINSSEVSGLLVPLPPLDEQTEIVRRIEKLFQQADAIEARYRKAKTFTDKLMPSVLAKAFRGELG